MRRALDEVVVTGIQTTLPFDHELVRDEAFLDDDGSHLATDWVAERWDGPASRRRAQEVAARIAADTFRDGVAGVASLRKDSDPRSGWRRTGRDAAVDSWPR